MDPILNCVLEVCCPGGSEAQLEALAKFMVDQGATTNGDDAKKYAAIILQYFDLAEKGTLAPLKASIARLARGPAHTV